MENIEKMQELERKIQNYVPSKKHDVYALEVIKVALNAAKNGNFGVGAILVNNETNEIMYRGQNKVFSESRSDLHAEMDLLNTFETQNGSKSKELIKKFALYTSLESCPMCLCRLITSGIMEVYHFADDPTGGMVHLYNQLPVVWQEISKGRTYKKADCSEDLSTIAEEVFLMTMSLNEKLSA